MNLLKSLHYVYKRDALIKRCSRAAGYLSPPNMHNSQRHTKGRQVFIPGVLSVRRKRLLHLPRAQAPQRSPCARRRMWAAAPWLSGAPGMPAPRCCRLATHSRQSQVRRKSKRNSRDCKIVTAPSAPECNYFAWVLGWAELTFAETFQNLHRHLCSVVCLKVQAHQTRHRRISRGRHRRGRWAASHAPLRRRLQHAHAACWRWTGHRGWGAPLHLQQLEGQL